MKCTICNEIHDEKSGRFLKHIKDIHNVPDRTTYYYLSHDEDLCEICRIHNKHIKLWNYEKSSTCENKLCVKISSNLKKSKAQINLSVYAFRERVDDTTTEHDLGIK